MYTPLGGDLSLDCAKSKEHVLLLSSSPGRNKTNFKTRILKTASSSSFFIRKQVILFRGGKESQAELHLLHYYPTFKSCSHAKKKPLDVRFRYIPDISIDQTFLSLFQIRYPRRVGLFVVVGLCVIRQLKGIVTGAQFPSSSDSLPPSTSPQTCIIRSNR